MFHQGLFKNGGQTIHRISSIDIRDGVSWKFRIAKIASTFMVDALAIGETLEIIKKIDSAKFCDFLGFRKCAKRN
jgi:hypothetical protein